MFKKTIFESPATCRPHFESRASTSYFTCAWCVCIIVSRSFSQIAKLAKLNLTRTCAKCNLAIIVAFFKKKRAIYAFLQSGNTVEKVYNRARVAKKRALHFTSTRPPSFLCYSGLSLLRVSWESPSLSGGHEICYY